MALSQAITRVRKIPKKVTLDPQLLAETLYYLNAADDEVGYNSEMSGDSDTDTEEAPIRIPNEEKEEDEFEAQILPKSPSISIEYFKARVNYMESLTLGKVLQYDRPVGNPFPARAVDITFQYIVTRVTVHCEFARDFYPCEALHNWTRSVKTYIRRVCPDDARVAIKPVWSHFTFINHSVYHGHIMFLASVREPLTIQQPGVEPVRGQRLARELRHVLEVSDDFMEFCESDLDCDGNVEEFTKMSLRGSFHLPISAFVHDPI